MIWIQENKGLAAFLGLCLVGCAALGFMNFGSYQGYSAALSDFESSRKAVEALENKTLFPDEESIKLKKEAVDAYAKEVSQLREKLVTFQSPLNAILTGNEFQGRLTEQVERIQGLATEKKVELPEEFRLDFDRWVSQPAPQNAVPKLDFQLEAIGDLVTLAIDSGISSVISVKRSELAEESGGSAEPSKKPVGIVAVPPLLERYPVEIAVKTSHAGLVKVINALSNASQTPKHYFIIRLVEVQNEAMEGPLKEDTFVPEPIYTEQDGGAIFDPLAPAPAPTDPGAVPPVPGGPAPVDPVAPPVDPTQPVDPTLPVDPGSTSFPAPAFGAGTPDAYRDARVLLGEEELRVFLKVEVIRFKPDLDAGEENAPAPAGS